MRLADAAGLDAVTVRSVAGRLGLAPAALYRYHPSKDALVEAAADRAMDDLALPPVTGELAADLLALVRAQIDVLRAHPWLMDTLPGIRPGARAIAVLEQGLVIMDDTTAPSSRKLELLGVLTGIATLFARSGGAAAPRTLEALVAAAPTHPQLAAAFREGAGPSAPDELLARTTKALVRAFLD